MNRSTGGRRRRYAEPGPESQPIIVKQPPGGAGGLDPHPAGGGQAAPPPRLCSRTPCRWRQGRPGTRPLAGPDGSHPTSAGRGSPPCPAPRAEVPMRLPVSLSSPRAAEYSTHEAHRLAPDQMAEPAAAWISTENAAVRCCSRDCAWFGSGSGLETNLRRSGRGGCSLRIGRRFARAARPRRLQGPPTPVQI